MFVAGKRDRGFRGVQKVRADQEATAGILGILASSGGGGAVRRGAGLAIGSHSLKTKTPRQGFPESVPDWPSRRKWRL
jgi:hypothetical protein